MSDNNIADLTRRSVLGGVAALGIAGAGVASFSGTVEGATSSLSVTSGDATVTNDRGDVTRVTADPSFTVDWENLDDAVGKVFYLVEASVDGGDFQPLFRATPWLSAGAIGTTGSLVVEPTHSDVLNQDDRFDGVSYSAGPLVIADEDGRPDYEGIDFDSIGGVDLQSFLDGTSMGGADDYPGVDDANGHQNNYPAIDAGYYGAASNTAPFDNGEDGTTTGTPVSIRYTFELQRPNLSQLKYRVDTSGDDTPSWSDLTTAEQKQFAADQIDGLEVSDIDEGNSTIVMNGEDGNAEFATPSGIPYSDLQSNADTHVGILTDTTDFTVSVTNEAATSGVDGSSNTGAE